MTTRRFCARPSLVVVRRDRLLFAVADHVDLVQRNLVLLVEIPLHGFGALPDRASRSIIASPVLSVWPSISTHTAFLSAFSCADHRVDARPVASSGSSALPSLNWPRSSLSTVSKISLRDFAFDARPRALRRCVPTSTALFGACRPPLALACAAPASPARRGLGVDFA